MTDAEVEMIWLYVSEVWPTFTIPDDEDLQAVKMQAWLDQLGDLEPSLVRAALVVLGSSPYAPPLGRVREEALQAARKLRGEPPVPDLDQAWAEVTETIHRVGRYGSPKWSHPAVAATVDAIGWLELCDSTEHGVMRGQFARLFESARQRMVQEDDPAPPAVADLLRGAPAPLARVDEILELKRGES